MSNEMTMEEAFEKLDDEDKSIVNEICTLAITALLNEGGGMVVLADLNGRGDCRIATCGNPLVAMPLVSAAKQIIKNELEPDNRMMQ